VYHTGVQITHNVRLRSKAALTFYLLLDLHSLPGHSLNELIGDVLGKKKLNKTYAIESL